MSVASGADATGIYYTNYRVAVGPLGGQGWERKRPTLPRLHREKTIAVGIGLFPLNTLLDEEWVQRSPRRSIILPNVLVTSPLPICQITPTTNHHPHTN